MISIGSDFKALILSHVMALLFSSLTVIRGLTEINKLALLVLFMLFAFCGVGFADVITLSEGSVFEGEVVGKYKRATVVKVDDGTVHLGEERIVSVEDRKPTADEKARLIRFKTERYDVTWETGPWTPLEEELWDLDLEGMDPDLSNEARAKILAEEFNLPLIIVWMILSY